MISTKSIKIKTFFFLDYSKNVEAVLLTPASALELAFALASVTQNMHFGS
jgi:hypothetical protein